MRYPFMIALSLFLQLSAVDEESKSPQRKNYQSLLGMKGFSDQALDLHIKLYEGYVKNVEMLGKKIRELAAEGKDRTLEYAGLKRMYGWEYDGMRLHEYYFDNLRGDGKAKGSIAKAIEKEFGSFENWKRDFISTGMIRGIGWAVLYYDTKTKALVNTWIDEHDLGHLVDNRLLIAMDVFEHAYLIDYGLAREQYIEAFFHHLNWEVVERRYQEALIGVASKLQIPL